MNALFYWFPTSVLEKVHSMTMLHAGYAENSVGYWTICFSYIQMNVQEVHYVQIDDIGPNDVGL